ncbi:MAG TPA: hypothetical protein VHK03_09415 [Aestuariivirgaceae bacterium]|nr:hypothetical protein [Aestuariivirgaceae bacterium]
MRSALPMVVVIAEQEDLDIALGGSCDDRQKMTCLDSCELVLDSGCALAPAQSAFQKCLDLPDAIKAVLADTPTRADVVFSDLLLDIFRTCHHGAVVRVRSESGFTGEADKHPTIARRRGLMQFRNLLEAADPASHHEAIYLIVNLYHFIMN